MKYIWYKHKIAGPFTEVDSFIPMWKSMVDSGKMDSLEDSPFLNDDMRNYPNDVHILCRPEL